MAGSRRRRRIEPSEPGGRAICLLTPNAARQRRVPIDRLLDEGAFRATADGYEVRLRPAERTWQLAEAFIEEEARCCPSFAFEAAESDDAIIVRGQIPDFTRRA